MNLSIIESPSIKIKIKNKKGLSGKTEFPLEYTSVSAITFYNVEIDNCTLPFFEI